MPALRARWQSSLHWSKRAADEDAVSKTTNKRNEQLLSKMATGLLCVCMHGMLHSLAAVFDGGLCIHKDAPTRSLLSVVSVVGFMNDTRHCTLDARSLHARSTLMTRINARLQNTKQNHKYDVIHKKKENV